MFKCIKTNVYACTHACTHKRIYWKTNTLYTLQRVYIFYFNKLKKYEKYVICFSILFY